MPRTLTAHLFSSVVTERGDLLLTYRPHARH